MGKNKNLFKAILPWFVVLVLLASIIPALNRVGGSDSLSYSEFVSVVESKDKKITKMTLTPGTYIVNVEGTYTSKSNGKTKERI